MDAGACGRPCGLQISVNWARASPCSGVEIEL